MYNLPATLVSVVAAADGNPLFALSLINGLLDGGSISVTVASRIHLLMSLSSEVLLAQNIQAHLVGVVVVCCMDVMGCLPLL